MARENHGGEESSIKAMLVQSVPISVIPIDGHAKYLDFCCSSLELANYESFIVSDHLETYEFSRQERDFLIKLKASTKTEEGGIAKGASHGTAAVEEEAGSLRLDFGPSPSKVAVHVSAVAAAIKPVVTGLRPAMAHDAPARVSFRERSDDEKKSWCDLISLKAELNGDTASAERRRIAAMATISELHNTRYVTVMSGQQAEAWAYIDERQSTINQAGMAAASY
eukprot:1528290-Amphidinium_carterae.1